MPQMENSIPDLIVKYSETQKISYVKLGVDGVNETDEFHV